MTFIPAVAEDQLLSVSCPELFFGIRVRMFGSGVPFSKHSLIILNHRCHFDWFFFWMVAARAGDINHWTVMVKYLAKMLPIFGEQGVYLP